MSGRSSHSLVRQIELLLLGTLVLALLGSVAIHLQSARGTVQAQLQRTGDDNAATLARALSQQPAKRETVERLLAAQFDTGAYRQIRFEFADGSAPFARAIGPVRTRGKGIEHRAPDAWSARLPRTVIRTLFFSHPSRSR